MGASQSVPEKSIHEFTVKVIPETRLQEPFSALGILNDDKDEELKEVYGLWWSRTVEGRTLT